MKDGNQMGGRRAGAREEEKEGGRRRKPLRDVRRERVECMGQGGSGMGGWE